MHILCSTGMYLETQAWDDIALLNGGIGDKVSI